MIKGFALIEKRADVSTEYFHRHWREVHAPLALRIKSLRRYVQSHRLPQGIAGFDQVPFNGAAEIWFDDLPTMLGMATNPDYLNGAYLDEPNFIDQSKLAFLATREHVFIEGPKIDKTTPQVKAIFLLRRRTDMTVDEFQDYWRTGHAPQIPRDAGIVRYVQCHVAPETYGQDTPPAYDGVAELTFTDLAAFEQYWSSPPIQAIFAADAPRFLDGANCTAFLADQNRVIWP